MITIKNVRNLDGSIGDYSLDSSQDREIDAHDKLLLLPALIAPHLNFETPDHPFPLAWDEGAKYALRSGITTILNMPEQVPCITKDQLLATMKDIDHQLANAEIPLDYKLYLEADREHLNEIGLAKQLIVGVTVFLGSPVNEKVITHSAILDRLFQIAGMENVIIAPQILDDPLHPNETLINKATETAIKYAIKYSNQLFLSRISTREQVKLLREAQLSENLIYGSTTADLLTHAKDREALWDGIHDESIDMIACDAHELKTYLPQLFQAYRDKKIKLEEIVNTTVVNPSNIFNIERNNDAALIDPESGNVLYTILKGKIY